MNQRAVGKSSELLAADYLRRQGMKILERNWRCQRGEIDLIGRDGPYLVFVEVKYRSGTGSGLPGEAVGFQKQKRIRNAARCYLYSHRYGEDIPCRFDVVGILGSEISWIRDAF